MEPRPSWRRPTSQRPACGAGHSTSHEPRAHGSIPPRASSQSSPADAIHCIRCDLRKWDFSCQRTLYHLNCKHRLSDKNDGFRHVGCGEPRWIAGPALGKTPCSINEGVTPNRHITAEHSSLVVRDLGCRTGVLARDAARWLALLKKTGLIDDKKRVVCGEILGNAIPHDVEQGRRVPPSTAQNCLLCRVGTGSPTASARIQPVLRRSSPSNPFRNRFADAGTRSCVTSHATDPSHRVARKPKFQRLFD
jgi:hypothetical protein